MTDHALLKRLNNILDLFVCGSHQNPKATRTYGLDQDHPLQLEGMNSIRFDSAVEDLLNLIPDGKNTLSKEKVEKELIPEIQRKKMEKTNFTEADSDLFRQKLQNIPTERFRVWRPIYGIMLPEGGAPISMGDFRVYDANSFLTQIHRELPKNSPLHESKRLQGPHILIEVFAKDSTKALELADALFYRFELIMRFFIGRRTEQYEVGILNYSGPQMRDNILIGESQVVEGAAWQGSLQLIPLADKFFTAPPAPFIKLLHMITKKSNQLETHILRCAEWTGQAMGDPNAASAFVKAATALEVMFSANEKGVITPSIMAQISESCAFLLGKSEESAKEIERDVKHLYGVRSAVVHSGKDSVPKDDLDTLIQICRDVVLTLLSGKEFEGKTSIESLAEHFKAKKYASMNSGST
jgi:hypothetical protein